MLLAGGIVAVLFCFIIGGAGAWWWFSGSATDSHSSGVAASAPPKPMPKPDPSPVVAVTTPIPNPGPVEVKPEPKPDSKPKETAPPPKPDPAPPEVKPEPKPDSRPKEAALPPKPDPSPVVIKPEPKPDSRPKETASVPKPDTKLVGKRPGLEDLKPPPPAPKDPVTGAEIRRFPVPLTKGKLNNMAVSGDGRYVLILDGLNLILYDGASGKELRRLKGLFPTVTAIAFLPDGRHCLGASYDKNVHIWEVETGTEVRTLKHESQVYCLAVSSDGRYILTGSGQPPKIVSQKLPPSPGCLVQLWEAETGKEIRSYQGHTQYVTAVAFAADARQLVSYSRFENRGRIWDLESGKEVALLEKFPAAGPGHLNVTPNGRYALFNDYSSSPHLRLYDLQADKEARLFKTPGTSTSDVVLLPDGRHAVSTGGGVTPKDDNSPKVDCVLRIWEVPEGKEVARFEADGPGIGRLSVTSDGRQAFTLNGEGIVQVWDLTRRPKSESAGTGP